MTFCGATTTPLPARSRPSVLSLPQLQSDLVLSEVLWANAPVKGGRRKPAAASPPRRPRQMRAVKRVAGEGVPGSGALAGWGVIARANTPQPIVKRMYEELAKALKDPGVAQKLTDQGMDIVGGGPQDLDKFLRSEITRWAAVVRENKIKAGD